MRAVSPELLTGKGDRGPGDTSHPTAVGFTDCFRPQVGKLTCNFR